MTTWPSPWSLPNCRRIRAVLRRGNRPANAVLLWDPALDRVTQTVQRSGHSIELSPKEFALPEFLMRFAGQPVTRTAIVEQVWSLNFGTMTNVVDVYINYLRRKLDTRCYSSPDSNHPGNRLPDRRPWSAARPEQLRTPQLECLVCMRYAIYLILDSLRLFRVPSSNLFPVTGFYPLGVVN